MKPALRELLREKDPHDARAKARANGARWFASVLTSGMRALVVQADGAGFLEILEPNEKPSGNGRELDRRDAEVLESLGVLLVGERQRLEGSDDLPVGHAKLGRRPALITSFGHDVAAAIRAMTKEETTK